ncbi:MAG TPA: arylamine N-acetyltransferase [Thermoanaerobaculaceae bacterium]|nr:arylamine N-acetyltransferase [Thermoanaerobaculaceae bacterium]
MIPTLSDAQVDVYLRALGVAKTAPTQRALDELVRAQATRVPFENISKLYRFKHQGLAGIPSIEDYLEGIVRFHFGGTCYPNNFHFCRLLRSLGFDAALCGADMPSGEDVHAAITVAIDGRDLLVDVGYGAPFLEPLPRDAANDVVLRYGRDFYVLRPRDGQGRSRLDMYRDGELLHGYLLKPTPRPIEHFSRAVRASFREDATFMNAVDLIRFSNTDSVVIYNLSIIRSWPDRFSIERLPDREALVQAIEREFGIPAEIARDAIAGLGALRDVHG